MQEYLMVVGGEVGGRRAELIVKYLFTAAWSECIRGTLPIRKNISILTLEISHAQDLEL